MFEFIPTPLTLNIRIGHSRFEAANVPEFKTALEEHCDRSFDSIIIDVSEVEMIDSSAVGALLGVQKRLSSGSQPVTLQNPNASVQAVIEMLRLHRVFRIETSEAGESQSVA